MFVYWIGGSPDWVCANSEEEAIAVFRKHYIHVWEHEDIEDELAEFPPEKLTEQEMIDHLYRKEVAFGEYKDITYAEELTTRTKPEMFAFSEY